jgi:hypothetical protein
MFEVAIKVYETGLDYHFTEAPERSCSVLFIREIRSFGQDSCFRAAAHI